MAIRRALDSYRDWLVIAAGVLVVWGVRWLVEIAR